MFLLNSFIIAFLFSFFLYADYFDYSTHFLNTIFSPIVFLLLLRATRKVLFVSGFFIGVLWFWWLGYSFIYYDLSWMIPFVVMGIGVLYGFLFFVAGFFSNLFLKATYFIILSFINPFGFNWFKMELLFVNSYFLSSKFILITIIIASALLLWFYQRGQKKQALIIYGLSIFGVLLFSFVTQKTQIIEPSLKINLLSTNIAQKEKWKRENAEATILNLKQEIENSIDNNFDLVVLPETALPLVLNQNKFLLNELKEYSKSIRIIVGSLYNKDGLLYNSSYFFDNEVMSVANKVVLVPFGEAVPLPQKIRDWINNTFYNGAKDYEVALKPTDFDISGIKFRNAICYEATTDKIFENLDTHYMIVLSNNAWFIPSVQPTLQKLLLKHYAMKYNVKIYSVTNGSGSMIIN